MILGKREHARGVRSFTEHFFPYDIYNDVRKEERFAEIRWWISVEVSVTYEEASTFRSYDLRALPYFHRKIQNEPTRIQVPSLNSTTGEGAGWVGGWVGGVEG